MKNHGNVQQGWWHQEPEGRIPGRGNLFGEQEAGMQVGGTWTDQGAAESVVYARAAQGTSPVQGQAGRGARAEAGARGPEAGSECSAGVLRR